MSTRDTSEGFEVPRRRRRPAKSCDQCRNRKVRCDLNQPCGPCQRARSALACSYREGVRGAQRSRIVDGDPQRSTRAGEISAPDEPLSRSPPAAPLHERQRQEAESNIDTGIKSLHDRLQFLEEQSIRRQSNTQQQTLDRLLERLERLEQRINTIDGNSPTNLPDSSNTSELFVSQIPPRLRAVPEKTKFYGPSHWLHTAEKVKPTACKSKRTKSLTGRLIDSCHR